MSLFCNIGLTLNDDLPHLLNNRPVVVRWTYAQSARALFLVSSLLRRVSYQLTNTIDLHDKAAYDVSHHLAHRSFNTSHSPTKVSSSGHMTLVIAHLTSRLLSVWQESYFTYCPQRPWTTRPTRCSHLSSFLLWRTGKVCKDVKRQHLLSVVLYFYFFLCREP